MTWRIRFDGIEFTDDDMTLEELEAYESFTEESWLIANPVGSVKAAKAFLTIALLRAGMTDEQAVQRLSDLTRSQLKGVFSFEPDAEAIAAMQKARDDDAAPLARSNGSSGRFSSGVSADGAGPRKKRAPSG